MRNELSRRQQEVHSAKVRIAQEEFYNHLVKRQLTGLLLRTLELLPLIARVVIAMCPQGES